MLIFGERQLAHVLTEDENHYNTHRPHRVLERLPPIGDVGLDRADGHGTVQRTEILGGLINDYRDAA
jgi:putative transposase